MKLWQKGEQKKDAKTLATENFTISKDRTLDIRLTPYDVQGSLAHAEMLSKAGIISTGDFHAIEKGLEEIMREVEAGRFVIEEHVEDIHSQIEKTLTQKIGDAGKKLHTGRSRNDQVLLDIKLFPKHE